MFAVIRIALVMVSHHSNRTLRQLGNSDKKRGVLGIAKASINPEYLGYHIHRGLLEGIHLHVNQKCFYIEKAIRGYLLQPRPFYLYKIRRRKITQQDKVSCGLREILHQG